MKLFKNFSISTKLKFIILFTSIAAFLLTGTVILVNDFLFFQNKYVQDLKMLARITGIHIQESVQEHHNGKALQILEVLSENPYIMCSAYYDSTGFLRASWSRNQMYKVSSNAEIKKAVYHHRNRIYIYEPIYLDGKLYGIVFIQRDKGELYIRFLGYLGLMIFILVGAVFFVLFLSTRLEKMIFTPLKELSEVSAHISKNKDYSIRALKQNEDEVGVLVDCYNDMLEQIHLRDEKLQFAYDDLEMRVEERTIELAKMNADLEREIKERRCVENKMADSINEKDLLLKEIHHRVKNNLQVISSLLSLQSQHIHEAHALAMFKESQDRVRSMALVHEKIYQSHDMAQIDFDDYIQSLVKSLFRSYGTNPEKVQLSFITENVMLGIDMAVPCALILNELISNALKHAFPDLDSNRGQIQVGLRKLSNSNIELCVADNGVGLKEEIDSFDRKSLGMQLVHILIEDQLMGTLDIQRNDGTKFIIQFNPHVHLTDII